MKHFIYLIFTLIVFGCSSNKNDDFKILEYSDINKSFKKELNIDLRGLKDSFISAEEREKCFYKDFPKKRWFYDCNCLTDHKDLVDLKDTTQVDTVIKHITEILLSNIVESKDSDKSEVSTAKEYLRSIENSNVFYHHNEIFLVSSVDQFAQTIMEKTNLSTQEINYTLAIKCILTELGTISNDQSSEIN